MPRLATPTPVEETIDCALHFRSPVSASRLEGNAERFDHQFDFVPVRSLDCEERSIHSGECQRMTDQQ
jgi:hypothetical protein